MAKALIRIFIWLSGLACLSLIFILEAGAGAKRSERNPGWTFDQVSQEAGRGETIVSNDGARIKLRHVTAVVKAPALDATIFDITTRKCVDLPYAVWSERYKTNNPPEMIDTGRTKTIAGLKARCYRTYSKKRRTVRDVWFTTDLKISPKMSIFVAQALRVPGGHGMPLRVELTRPGGKKEVQLDTLRLTRSDNIDAKTFRIPAGMKRVESEYELFVKEENIEDMGGFLK